MKLTTEILKKIIKEELAEAPNFTKGARRSQPPEGGGPNFTKGDNCLLYTSPSPRDS